MKASEAKKFIGKFVRFKRPTHPAYYPEWEYGWVDGVDGRNINLADDWMWLPDIIKMEEFDPNK